ncbi:MAG: hypothetical protein NTX86_05385 [Candidatus Dependentiae bacterium]|nr:hypothetical protein [Candidatus Dependentiae bacterium]
MTIKKTTLGFMAAALLIGANVYQASDITVRPYNKITDEKAVRTLIEKNINILLDNISKTASNNDVLTEINIMKLKSDIFSELKRVLAQYQMYIYSQALVLESDMGIQGFLNLCTVKQYRDMTHHETSLWLIALEGKYMNHASFQEIFDKVMLFKKDMIELQGNEKLVLTHMALTHEEECNAMLEQMNFNFISSTTSTYTDFFRNNQYELILQ